jgi:DNA-binding Lrp family transcriptional regulator
MSELAESVLLSLSGVSRLVERLERRGLVTREPCPEDRRGAFAVLTSDGLALVRQARATHWAGIRERFLRHFSGEDLEQLATYWARVLEEDPLLEIDAHPDVGGGAACEVTVGLSPVPARSEDAAAATGTRRKQGVQRERGETEGER